MQRLWKDTVAPAKTYLLCVSFCADNFTVSSAHLREPHIENGLPAVRSIQVEPRRFILRVVKLTVDLTRDERERESVMRWQPEGGF